MVHVSQAQPSSAGSGSIPSCSPGCDDVATLSGFFSGAVAAGFNTDRGTIGLEKPGLPSGTVFSPRSVAGTLATTVALISLLSWIVGETETGARPAAAEGSLSFA